MYWDVAQHLFDIRRELMRQLAFRLFVYLQRTSSQPAEQHAQTLGMLMLRKSLIRRASHARGVQRAQLSHGIYMVRIYTHHGRLT